MLTHSGKVLFVYPLEMALWEYQICPKMAHMMTSVPVPISWYSGKATQYVLWKQGRLSLVIQQIAILMSVQTKKGCAFVIFQCKI